MMRMPATILGGLAALALAAQAPAPTPAQAEKLVTKAVEFAKANGIDKLIAETNQANGRFHVGTGSQLYIFIYDAQGVCKAIGFDTQALVGKNRIDLKDMDGKFFIREILSVAKAKGSGWVDYKYPNPQTGKVQAKTSYVVMCQGYIVGSGVYKD